jgi:nucleoid-associated protein YgaU
MFAPGSRYETVPEAVWTGPDGRQLPFKLLRVLPDAPRTTSPRGHRVTAADRLDLLAHEYLGDPEAYWRLGDANRALRPDDLLLPPGRRLVVPLQVA